MKLKGGYLLIDLGDDFYFDEDGLPIIKNELLKLYPFDVTKNVVYIKSVYGILPFQAKTDSDGYYVLEHISTRHIGFKFKYIIGDYDEKTISLTITNNVELLEIPVSDVDNGSVPVLQDNGKLMLKLLEKSSLILGESILVNEEIDGTNTSSVTFTNVKQLIEEKNPILLYFTMNETFVSVVLSLTGKSLCVGSFAYDSSGNTRVARLRVEIVGSDLVVKFDTDFADVVSITPTAYLIGVRLI